jgi:hypothetical protein
MEAKRVIQSGPSSAKEWIEACLTAVVEAQKEHDTQTDKDDPAPAKPDAGSMTESEYEAAEDARNKWEIRQMLNRVTGKGGAGRLGKAATAQAFLRMMPPLTNRANTKAFIACLATGLQRSYLTASEVKMLVYTAQLALQAFQPRAKKGHSPR